MDALKFAFEILIVGALALPWLGLLILILCPSPASVISAKPPGRLEVFLSIVPEHAHDAVGAVAIIALGYLLGSGVSRVSRNFFNDELWGKLPTEDQIRVGVYRDEYCRGNLLSDLHLPDFAIKDHPRIPEWLCAQTANSAADKPAPFNALVQEMFRLQESQLLLNGQDKVDRLKQYYDQITVLRGGALNGIILCAVCAFGICGNFRARVSGRALNILAFLPAVAVVLYGAIALWEHWHGKADTRYTDPPLAELVLLLIGVIGIFVVLKAKDARFYFSTCVVAALITMPSIGGWWWTEVMYDLQVIHSVPELTPRTHDRTSQVNVDPLL